MAFNGVKYHIKPIITGFIRKLKTLTFCPYKINFLSSNTIKANSLIYDTHLLEILEPLSQICSEFHGFEPTVNLEA